MSRIIIPGAREEILGANIAKVPAWPNKDHFKNYVTPDGGSFFQTVMETWGLGDKALLLRNRDFLKYFFSCNVP